MDELMAVMGGFGDPSLVKYDTVTYKEDDFSQIGYKYKLIIENIITSSYQNASEHLWEVAHQTFCKNVKEIGTPNNKQIARSTRIRPEYLYVYRKV